MPAVNPEKALVPDRECGACTACCIHLRIDEEALQKEADTSCTHLSATKGCGIYDDRPGVCRGWYCGWRMLDFLDEGWRPDLCGIMIRVEPTRLVLQATGSIRAYFTNPVLQFIGAAIDSGKTIAVNVRGKPGHTSATMELNGELAAAVTARDKKGVIEGVIAALEFGAKYPTDPVSPFTYPIKKI